MPSSSPNCKDILTSGYNNLTQVLRRGSKSDSTRSEWKPGRTPTTLEGCIAANESSDKDILEQMQSDAIIECEKDPPGGLTEFEGQVHAMAVEKLPLEDKKSGKGVRWICNCCKKQRSVSRYYRYYCTSNICKDRQLGESGKPDPRFFRCGECVGRVSHNNSRDKSETRETCIEQPSPRCWYYENKPMVLVNGCRRFYYFENKKLNPKGLNSGQAEAGPTRWEAMQRANESEVESEAES